MTTENQAENQAEQRYRSLLDLAPDAIVILDLESGLFIEEANPKAEEMFGLKREEILGKLGPVDLSPERQPNGERSTEEAVRHITKAMAEDVTSFEWTHQNHQGVEFPCQIILSRFPDSDRNVVRASMIDLTEWKKAEQKRVDLESKLLHARKLETIGEMTGGIAHDFNNLLGAILGNLELLDIMVDDPKAKPLIEEAIAATLKGSELTRSMLNYARQAPLQFKAIHLSEVVQGMEKLIVAALRENIRVEFSSEADANLIRTDVNGVESALLNLVLNARDAMPDGGVLTIDTQGVDVHGNELVDNLPQGRFVRLSVSDTGSGIPDEIRDKVFDPFFSTKGDTQANSGLGLSMIHGFMKQTGGHVSVDCPEGGGTIFQLYFPVDEDSENPTKANVSMSDSKSSMPSLLSPNPVRVLVAEDQDAVREVTRKYLEMAGHTVHTAGSGDAALELAQSEEVDLLITDIRMPGQLNGFALAAQLRQQTPTLPVIFMSGYSEETDFSGNEMNENDPQLMKPFGRKELF